MVANSEFVFKEVYDVNHMIRLWVKISSSTILKVKLFEFIN